MDIFRKKVIVAIVFWALIVILGAGYFFRQPISDFLKKFPWKPKVEDKKEVKRELELQKQASEIIKTRDFSQCEEIKDVMYKAVCVNNIAMNLAKETQDISYCQKIDDKLMSREDCERQIILPKSIEREDINVCKETQNQDLQKQCKNSFYPQIALKKEDINACSLAPAKEEQDACRNNYLVVKDFSEDPKNFKCSLLIGADAQSDCKKMKEISGTAIPGPGIANFDLCTNLISDLFLNYCNSNLIR